MEEETKKKRCCRCKSYLPATSEYFNQNCTQKYGLDGWCRNCKKEYDKIRHKRYKYKLTISDFNKMLKNQNNRCAICGINFTNYFPFQPFIDHDHGNQKIRGLLCNNCNLLLGHAFDRVFTISNAIHYLKMHKGDNETY
ncbi:MAG: endonuclease domain-containing protein [Promethearchaeota archaeon]